MSRTEEGQSVVIAKKQDDSDSDGDVLRISSEKSCEAWLLDSASSFHATPKEWFSSYIENYGGLAHLGDDQVIVSYEWVRSNSRCVMDMRCSLKV